jgi:hypothetical protein
VGVRLSDALAARLRVSDAVVVDLRLRDALAARLRVSDAVVVDLRLRDAVAAGLRVSAGPPRVSVSDAVGPRLSATAR